MYDIITRNVERVLEYSHNLHDLCAGPLIKEWAKAKECFLNWFDGPIFEWPDELEFTVSDEVKAKTVHSFMDYIDTRYY